MAGMTMDPQQCTNAKIMLVIQSSVWGINAHSLLFEENGWTLPVGMTGGAVLPDFLSRNPPWSKTSLTRLIWDLPSSFIDYLDHCEGGEGLKQKLQQFRASASKVVGKISPPIPVGAKYGAVDLPTDSGLRSTSLPGDILTRGGTGMVDHAIWGIAGAAVLIYGGFVLAPIVAPAVPAFAPAFVGAAVL